MTNKVLLEKTMVSISKLPNSKLHEVADFVEFLLSKEEEKNLQKGIEKISSDSDALTFLSDEEVFYSKADILS